MTFVTKHFRRTLGLLTLSVVLVCVLPACNLKRSLRFDSDYSKFFDATVRTTVDERLYNTTGETGWGRTDRNYHLGGARIGHLPHYLMPAGTELHIDGVYLIQGIDLYDVYALGYLYRNGEKLEFEASMPQRGDPPEWEVVEPR